jgi:transposase-like protein
MDNALRCPQSHSFSRRIVQLIELKDREERRRLSWIVAYRERPDAGAVCRRFCISRPTLRKWLRRYEAEGEVGLRALSRLGSPLTVAVIRGRVEPVRVILLGENRKAQPAASFLGARLLKHGAQRAKAAALIRDHAGVWRNQAICAMSRN